MVTVSSCTGNKRGGKKKKSYIQFQTWLLMSMVTIVKLLLITILIKFSPGQNVSSVLNTGNFSSDSPGRPHNSLPLLTGAYRKDRKELFIREHNDRKKSIIFKPEESRLRLDARKKNSLL